MGGGSEFETRRRRPRRPVSLGGACDAGRSEAEADQVNPLLGKFTFKDGAGKVDVVIMADSSFTLKVHGHLPADLLEPQAEKNLDHQDLILEFYVRGFTALNHFLERYRVRRFDPEVRPIRWHATSWRRNYVADPQSWFTVYRPAKLEQVIWTSRGKETKIPIGLGPQLGSTSHGASYSSYDARELEPIYTDVSKLLRGDELEAPVREAAYELLLHVEELLSTERRSRRMARSAVLVGALVATAAACEIYVRHYVRAHGSKLQKRLLKDKDQSFSVAYLLGPFLEAVPSVGTPLPQVNRELASNIRLLFDARNRSAHRGLPSVSLKKEQVDKAGSTRMRDVEYRIRARDIYDDIYEGDDDDDGFFTWDVAALIGWLESRVGGRLPTPEIERYWDRQRRLEVGKRQARFLEHA